MLVLSETIFKGLHNGMDRLAYNILVAKFLGSKTHTDYVKRYITPIFEKEVVSKFKFDCIVVAPNKDSNSKLTQVIGKYLAEKYNCPVYTISKGFVIANSLANAIPNKNILIIDDVVYSGRTIHSVANELKKYKPNAIKGWAFVKAKNFDESKLNIKKPTKNPTKEKEATPKKPIKKKAPSKAKKTKK